jgi:hypothetical protein
VYAWIWRKLPGGIPGKLLGTLVLLFATVMLLFLVIFPWASPKLPFNHVTIDSTPTPNPTTSSSSTTPAVPD